MDWSPYFAPIPDTHPYLTRIGLIHEQPSRAYLDALIYAHQCSVPFETLDVTDYGQAVSLRTDDLFAKIVIRKRGGYCFELNGLFVLLLQALGFDVYSCPARMRMHNEPLPIPIFHRGAIVRLDGKRLYCDVGYGGPMAAGSLDLDEQAPQTILGETFRFVLEPTHWYTLLRKATKTPDAWNMDAYPAIQNGGFQEVPLLSVDPAEYLPIDFYAPNLVRSQGEAAFPRRTVSIRKPDGYLSLIGNEFTEVRNGIKQKMFIPEEKIAEILELRFGLTR